MSGCLKHVDAMRDAHVRIACIHLREGYMIMEGGLMLPITDMFDENGDETDDPDMVMTVEAGTPEIGYIVSPIRRLPEYEWVH